MNALGLHGLIPASLLTGRWILVLTCYLDDSGKDPQNRITTLAGYLAREAEWKAFEIEVEPIFARYGVDILHAKDLEDTHGEFKGWKVLKKQSFVAEISKTLAKHSLIGLSYSIVKQTYKDRAAQSGKKRVVTSYAYAFNIILDWILRDIRTGKAVWSEGLAFVVECGHENNPDLEEQFYAIRKQHSLDGVLRSVSFVPKDNCRAIQVADLFSFYSRRDSIAQEKVYSAGKTNHKMKTMLKIITERGQFRGMVATDFHHARPS